MGINHSFMEVPDGVDETCLLLVFLFPHPDHRGIFSGGDDSRAGEEGARFSLSVMES